MIKIATSKRRAGITSGVREQLLKRPRQKPAPTFSDVLKDIALADAHSSYGVVYTRTSTDLHNFFFQLVHETLETYFNDGDARMMLYNNMRMPEDAFFCAFKRVLPRHVYGEKQQFDIERVIVESLPLIVLDNKSGIVVQGHGYITQAMVKKSAIKPGHVTFRFAARLTIETGEPVTVDQVSALYKG